MNLRIALLNLVRYLDDGATPEQVATEIERLAARIRDTQPAAFPARTPTTAVNQLGETA